MRIHLTVKDSGVGFDREQVKLSQGLGLVSMEERLKLVKRHPYNRNTTHGRRCDPSSRTLEKRFHATVGKNTDCWWKMMGKVWPLIVSGPSLVLTGSCGWFIRSLSRTEFNTA